MLVFRYILERGVSEHTKSVVNVVHRRCSITLIVAHDPPAGGFDITRVELILVLVNRHQTWRSGILKSFRDGTVFARQVRISIEHKKLAVEHRQRLSDRARRAKQLISIKRIVNAQPEI